MASHAPYIMPDGKPLSYYLKLERDRANKETKSSRKHRGKDDVWAQLRQQAGKVSSDHEAAELRVLQQVGNRRRLRWFNDKMLRDMAGPMTAKDMESMFAPPPYGVMPPPSAFAEAMAPENNGIWEHFRSVDVDKEARVLLKWTEHNKEQKQAVRQQQEGQQQLQQQSPASQALACWARVSRSARHALRKANVHSVLGLEMRMLDLIEKGQPEEELDIDTDGSFARLLVHGLAEFHGLASRSDASSGQCRPVVVYHRKLRTGQEQQQVVAGGGQQVEVTCTDVLLALREIGPAGLDTHSLEQFVRTHVHGHDLMDGEYVLV